MLCRPRGFLTGTRQYLPRKRSCAAVLGSWTGTGRRKKPLQGNHACSLVSGRDCTRPSREGGHSPGPGEERGEGQRRPGPAHRTPSSPNSMHSLWEVSAGQLLTHRRPQPPSTIYGHISTGLAGQGWQAGRQAQASHPRPGGCSGARSASSPRAMPIMEVQAKAPESSTQALPTPAASSWWWQQAPVSKEEGFFSRHKPAPKL